MESLIWLVPAMVLLGGAVQPRIGVVLFVSTLPLFGSPPGGPYLGSLDIAALAVIATTWRLSRPPPTKVDRLAGWFVTLSAVSMLPLLFLPPSFAPDVLLDLPGAIVGAESWSRLYSLRAMANLLLGWGLYSSVRRAFADHSLRPLGLALAVGVSMVCGLGILEQLGGVDLGFYRAIGDSMYASRLHSLFFHSGWLAEFLVISSPVAIAVCLGRGRKSRGAGLTLIVLTILTLALTQQRGGWIAGLSELVAVVVLSLRQGLGGAVVRRAALRVGGSVVAILLLTLVVAPEVVQPLQERTRHDSWDLSGRGQVWNETLSIAVERPLLGWGLGAFNIARNQYRAAHGQKVQSSLWLTPHNQYLMLLAERGAVGLLVMLLFLVSVFRGLEGAATLADREKRVVAMGLQVSLIGFSVYGLVQYIFFLKNIEFLFWIVVGAASLYSRESPTARESGPKPWRVLGVATLVLWRLITTEPLARGENRSYGFHLLEPGALLSLRWTNDRAAQRIAWESRVLVVPLANGHPRALENPVEVTIKIDGREMMRRDILGGWENFTFELGPPRKDWILFEIEATPTFRPFSDFRKYPELQPSPDIRRLGVAVGQISWTDG